MGKDTSKELPRRIIGIPISSTRCMVTFHGNTVRKYYFSRLSFEAEANVYNQLSGEQFVPKLISINRLPSYIDLEYIDAPTIDEYALIKGYIPYDFAINLHHIEKKMAELGLHDNPDLWKPDHIFFDKCSNSPITNGLRIIDFDAVLPISKELKFSQEQIDEQVSSVHKEYQFLTTDDPSSREAFIAKLASLVGKDIARDFNHNMRIAI